MKKLESSLKNMVIVLLGVTVICVALLAYMNELTKKPIAQAQDNILKEAIIKVVPAFDNNPVEEQKTFEVDGQQIKIFTAKKGGEFVGSAVEAKSPGYGGDVKILVGFDPEGKIYGYSVLAHSETPGLGSKATTWFQKDGKSSVIGLNPNDASFKVSKDGGKIDAITASTITSRAFLRAISMAYSAYVGSDSVDGTSGATASQTKGKE